MRAVVGNPYTDLRKNITFYARNAGDFLSLSYNSMEFPVP
jgi:hypothetical protein